MAKAQIEGPAVETYSLRRMPLDPIPSLPLVSILIPNYNYATYLSDAIESCLQQTYTNLEVIVCDDGSTDSSREILEHYRLMDPRVKLICKANGGQSAALNAAFYASTGDIICFLDSDDVFLPNKLQRVVGILTETPDSGFVVNRMQLVDKSGKCLAEIPSLFDIAQGWHGDFLSKVEPQILPGLPPTSGISLRRCVAQVIFPLPEGLKAYSDTLIQVLAPMMTPIAAIGTPMSKYRIHGANVGGVARFTEDRLRNIVRYEQEIWAAWRRYLATPFSGLPTDFPVPSKRTPSPMDYAYARFRTDQNFRAVYESIPPSRLHALPRLQQFYWRMSLLTPNWLFRRSFDFAYGHTPAKTVVRKALKRLRCCSRFRTWITKNLGKEGSAHVLQRGQLEFQPD